MTRFGVLLSTWTVVVLAGLSTAAYATHVPEEHHDPLCVDGAGNYLPLGIYQQRIETDQLDSHTPANSFGMAVACSGESYLGLDDTRSFFTKLDVIMPPGVFIANTLDLANGSLAGKLCGGALAYGFGYIGRIGALGEGPCFVGLSVSVDNLTPNRECLEETRGPLVACFRAQFWGGSGWMWVWRNEASKRYVLTVGRLTGATGEAGFTRLEPVNGQDPFDPPFQCAYLGRPASEVCGTPGADPLLFATGDPVRKRERRSCSAPGGYTRNGAGTFWMQATRRDGQTTDWVSTCIPWRNLS